MGTKKTAYLKAGCVLLAVTLVAWGIAHQFGNGRSALAQNRGARTASARQQGMQRARDGRQVPQKQVPVQGQVRSDQRMDRRIPAASVDAARKAAAGIRPASGKSAMRPQAKAARSGQRPEARVVERPSENPVRFAFGAKDASDRSTTAPWNRDPSAKAIISTFLTGNISPELVQWHVNQRKRTEYEKALAARGESLPVYAFSSPYAQRRRQAHSPEYMGMINRMEFSLAENDSPYSMQDARDPSGGTILLQLMTGYKNNEMKGWKEGQTMLARNMRGGIGGNGPNSFGSPYAPYNMYAQNGAAPSYAPSYAQPCARGYPQGEPQGYGQGRPRQNGEAYAANSGMNYQMNPGAAPRMNPNGSGYANGNPYGSAYANLNRNPNASPVSRQRLMPGTQVQVSAARPSQNPTVPARRQARSAMVAAQPLPGQEKGANIAQASADMGKSQGIRTAELNTGGQTGGPVMIANAMDRRFVDDGFPGGAERNQPEEFPIRQVGAIGIGDRGREPVNTIQPLPEFNILPETEKVNQPGQVKVYAPAAAGNGTPSASDDGWSPIE